MTVDNTPSLYTQKQCIHCRKFYTELENNHEVPPANQKLVCFYHKNSTCCKFDRSIGCIKSAKHTEDLGYSAIVANFPVHKETLEIMKQTHDLRKAGVGEGNASEILVEVPAQDDDNFIVHRVALTDTLIGIALYYNVKIEDIQKANNLDSHQIYHHKVLLVPRPDAKLVRPELQPKVPTEEQIKARRERQIKLFQQQTGVTEEEAKYYMETHDFKIDHAMRALKDDEKWNKEDSKQNQKQKKENQARRKARACC